MAVPRPRAGWGAVMSASEPALVSDSSRAAVPGRQDVPLLAVPGSAELFPAAVGEPSARTLGGLTAAHGPPGAWSGSPPTRPSPAAAGAAFRPVTVQHTTGLRRGVGAQGSAPGIPGERPARGRGAGLRAEEGVS